MKTIQKSAYSTKLYQRAVIRTRTNYVLQRKTNQNALLQNKKDANNDVTYDVPNYFTPLTYLNAE